MAMFPYTQPGGGEWPSSGTSAFLIIGWKLHLASHRSPEKHNKPQRLGPQNPEVAVHVNQKLGWNNTPPANGSVAEPLDAS